MIEHVDDPFALLERLESLAAIVVVNFLEPADHDPHVHKPLPIRTLLDRCASHGLLHYARHHGRSHLVAYRSQPSTGLVRRARSSAWRAAGTRPRGVGALRRAEHLVVRAKKLGRATPRAGHRATP